MITGGFRGGKLMLDITTPSGNRAKSDGECILILDSNGRELLSYHPLHGKQILGIHSVATLERLEKDFNHVKDFLRGT
jgi:hypothetical protein